MNLINGKSKPTMKSTMQIKTTNMDGSVELSSASGILRRIDGTKEDGYTYQFSYVEDLSNEGKKTKTCMVFSKKQLRITRSGEVNSDFIYEAGLIHNTNYETLYGMIPVSIETEKYNCVIERIENDASEVIIRDFTDNIKGNIEISYKLNMGGGEPMKVKLEMEIS